MRPNNRTGSPTVVSVPTRVRLTVEEQTPERAAALEEARRWLLARGITEQRPLYRNGRSK